MPAGVDSSAPVWSAYGLGLQVLRVEGRTLVGHGGSMPGFLAGVFVDREEQTGAVSLANTTTGLDAVVFGLLEDLRAAEPRIVEPWTPSPSPVPLDRLGVWFWGPAPLRAAVGRRRAAAPRAAAGRPGRASRFAPGDDGTWSAWTATSPARPCGSPRTTWTSTRSSSRASPTTRTPRCPGEWTSGAGARRVEPCRVAGAVVALQVLERLARSLQRWAIRGSHRTRPRPEARPKHARGEGDGSLYCSISTTTASTGRWPFKTMRSRRSASVTRRARPLMRSVSLRPGRRWISPTCGLARMLR